MAQHILTEGELRNHLNENINFLKLSSSSFDSGFISEAKRLAVTIRVILHDTPNSKSILEQIGIKNRILFYNKSTALDPRNLVQHNGLLLVKITDSGIEYVAPLSKTVTIPSRANKFVSFGDWWNEIVIKDSVGTTYTRKELVLIISNKDGGAHVDPKIDNNYQELKLSNRTNWFFVETIEGNELKTPISNIHLHSIRQIAYELIESLSRV